MVRKNTRRMHRPREDFFLEGKRQSTDPDPDVRALVECRLCRTPIDYVAAAGSTPDSHHLDHYRPVRDFPELQEDPDNFRHAHASCNQSRRADAPSAELGEPMPAWW